jgi:RHS repeat-associated protein
MEIIYNKPLHHINPFIASSTLGSASADWSMAMAAFKPAAGGTGSTTMYIIHADHLTGTNVVTDASGNVAEVADYYPYGTERISSGTFEEQRKFAGTEYDSSTGLNQMGARYYAGGKGRFLSQDPAVIGGDPSLLSDPQQLNFYSYARNNPLIYRDPDGRKVELLSRPVSVSGVQGVIISLMRPAHSFLKITPENSETIGKIGVDTRSPFTLGATLNEVNNPLKYKDEDGNTPLLLAIAGVGYGVAQQYFEDRHNINNGLQNGYSSVGTYVTSALKGVGVAFAAEAGILAAGGASVVGSLAQNQILNRPQDFTSIATDALGSMATAGVVKQLPGSIISLPKITAPQFNTESAKTLIRSFTSELSLGHAVAALAVQVKEIQSRIAEIKKQRSK